MSNEKDSDLDRLIASVANGEAVDWEAERARRPDLAPLLDEVRVAQAIASYHGGVAVTEEGAPTRWGPLRVLERIGRGGRGEVFRAFDPALQTQVALKLFPTALGSDTRALQEARRMARVRHPNVLAVRGADRHEGRAGMWADLIQGRTLEELLAAHGPFAAEEASRIGIDLCRALAAVHGAGLVHRDVKTTNIMREHGGRVVLMDFGAVGERGPQQAGELLEDGTPLTMAPEHLRGEPATPASDLYSLAVLLYRLVTGRFPVEADSYQALHALHDRGVHTPLRDLRPDLPAEFVNVIERGLESGPERRYASAGEFERALLAAGARPAADPSTQAPPHPMRAAVWVMLGLALAATLWWGVQRWREAGPEQRGRSQTATGEAGPNPRATSSIAPPGSAASIVASAALLLERGGVERALAPGDAVKPGDGLALKFQASEPMHVYVLDEDRAGEVFVLFPAPGLDRGNPLPAGPVHRLPGTRGGRPLSWRVTSAGGTETVIVVATRAPYEVLEREIAGFPRASLDHPVSYGRLSEGTLTRLRGIGGMTEANAPHAQRRLADLLRGLASGDSTAPWTWQIELANP
jgi:serine/threonine protein kinase